MKSSVGVALVATWLLGSASALAQSEPTRTETAQAFKDYCVSQPESQSVSNVAVQCACAAGVIEGHLTERQFIIMGRLVALTNDPDAEQAEVTRMIGEGYSALEIRAAGTIITNLADEVSETCDHMT